MYGEQISAGSDRLLLQKEFPWLLSLPSKDQIAVLSDQIITGDMNGFGVALELLHDFWPLSPTPTNAERIQVSFATSTSTL